MSTTDMIRYFGPPPKNPCCFCFGYMTRAVSITCCCDLWAYFGLCNCCSCCSYSNVTWRSTYLLRLFLSLYVTFGTILGFAFVIQLGGSIFAEFVITCIVLASEGYIFGLFLLPMLIYVQLSFLEFSWNCVVISFKINCDYNGDLQSQDSKLFEMSHQFATLDSNSMNSDIYNTNNTSANNTNPTTPTHLDSLPLPFRKDINHIIQYSYRVADSQRIHAPDTPEHENNSYSNYNNYNNYNNNSSNNLNNRYASNDLNRINETNEEDSDISDENEVNLNEEKIDTNQINSNETSNNNNNSGNYSNTSGYNTQEAELELYQKAIAKFFRIYDFSNKLPDYYLATCWRLWIFVISMLYTLFTCITVSRSVDISATFFIIWLNCLMICTGLLIPLLFLFSNMLCLYTHLSSWSSIHDLPYIYYIFMLDASDNEKFNYGNIGWRNCKILFNLISIGLILFFFIGFLAAELDGFLMFLSLILIAYILQNYFIISKGYALVALWRDNLPPPSTNLRAHETASIVLSFVFCLLSNCFETAFL